MLVPKAEEFSKPEGVELYVYIVKPLHYIMTKITTCAASLSVFVALCIGYGADPLQLADQKFLTDNSTGSATPEQYYFSSCMYDFNYSWYDLSGLS